MTIADLDKAELRDSTELENVSQQATLESLANAVEESCLENRVTLSFFMSMFSFSFVLMVAEAILLFLITLFTVIAYNVGAGDKALWLVTAKFIAIGAILPLVGPLMNLISCKAITIVSLRFTIVLLGITPNIASVIAAIALSGTTIDV